MNLKVFRDRVRAIVPKSNLEYLGAVSILDMYPEPPTDGVVSSLEEAAYAVAYALQVPDENFVDAFEYSEWLSAREVHGDDHRAWVRRFGRLKTMESMLDE